MRSSGVDTEMRMPKLSRKLKVPSKISRRVIAAVVLGSAAAGLVAAWVQHRPDRITLPVLIAPHTGASEPLNRELRRAHEAAVADPKNPERLRDLARVYQANGFLAEAAACFRAVESTSVGLSALDHYYIAQIALTRGDLPAAIEQLRKVTITEPGYVPARVIFADALFKSGDPDAAKIEYEAAFAIDPDEPRAALGLARIDLQREREAQAIARLEAVVGVHPNAAGAVALLAQLVSRRGDADRAEALVQQSRQAHEPVPADPWSDALWNACYDVQRLTLRFEEYLMADQMDLAEPLVNRLATLDPDNWLVPLLRGWSLTRAGKFDDAMVEYRAALAKGGSAEKIVPLAVRTLTAKGDTSGALRLLAEHAALKPDSVPINSAFADLALQSGDGKLAEKIYNEVLAREPYLYSANMGLAKILWSRGDRDLAVNCLKRVVKVFPVDVASRGLLGQYFLEKGQPESALVPLQEALPQAEQGTPAREKLKAMLTQALVESAGARAGRKNLPGAGAYLDRALELSPTDLNALAEKSGVCLQLNDLTGAAGILEKMVSLQPGNPTIELSLGDVLYQAGKRDGALDHWRRAAQLADQGDPALRQAIEVRLRGQITPETFQ